MEDLPGHFGGVEPVREGDRDHSYFDLKKSRRVER
jgi:hypothetical protein